MRKDGVRCTQNAMLASMLFPRTRRTFSDAPSASGYHLLVQAGYIRQHMAGVFTLYPLALRVLAKIEAIVREEMAAIGGLEVNAPIMQSREVWEQTGRWKRYVDDKIMFTGQDRKGQQFCLAPTAEELFCEMAVLDLTSHNQLPLTMWQMDWKFRDEIRPRLGLVRCKMFRMKDSYSFDEDEAGMRRSYELHRQAYDNMFKRMGFNFISVQADSGAIGGKGSAEFMAVCDVGEDVLLTCSNCDYGANVEKAESIFPPHLYLENQNPIRREDTPNIRTVEELERYFNLSGRDMMKTIIYVARVGDSYENVAVCCRGDLQISETKLANFLGASSVETASDTIVQEVTGAPVGFAGPINLANADRVVYDTSVEPMTNLLCGCNEVDVHMLDVNFGRDIERPEHFVDIHAAQAGDRCAQCDQGVLVESKGIEIGHIFMLQQGYAEKTKITFIGSDGEQHIPYMGCYGVGTTRCIQALVEQSHDEKGIIWPEAVAPYSWVVVPSTFQEGSPQRALAQQIYAEMAESGQEVVLDDRNIGFGAKMKDAELIGYPRIIVVGEGAVERRVEVQTRATGAKERYSYLLECLVKEDQLELDTLPPEG